MTANYFAIIYPCPSCGVEAGTTFDRMLCACGMMHNVCAACGVQADPCWDDYEVVGVLEDGMQGKRPVDVLAQALGYEPWNYDMYSAPDGRLLTLEQVTEEVRGNSHEDCKAALQLVRDSGLVFTDPRLKYAEIQVDREEYRQLMTKVHGESPYD